MPEKLHFRAVFDPPSGEFVVTFSSGPAKVEHRYLPDEFRRRVGEFALLNIHLVDPISARMVVIPNGGNCVQVGKI